MCGRALYEDAIMSTPRMTLGNSGLYTSSLSLAELVTL